MTDTCVLPQPRVAPLSDAELLAAIAEGDERAFEQLHARHVAGCRRRAAGVLATEEWVSAVVQAVFLDVWHGECRGARVATGADLDGADFVLEAAPTAWRQVLAARVSPVMALLTGQVTLARGELARLLPYTAAAKELVQLAGTIDMSTDGGTVVRLVVPISPPVAEDA